MRVSIMAMVVSAALVVAVSACGKPGAGSNKNGKSGDPSDAPVTLKDLQPDMAVTSALEVGGSQANVTLQARSKAWTLGDGDALTLAAADGAPVPLVASADGSSYGADIDVKDSGTKIVIALTRADGSAAPASTVTMTEQLGLSAPAAGTAFSRASDNIAVSWVSDPSKDPLTVTWSGPCITAGSIDVDHTDSASSISAGQIVGDGTCNISVGITRTRTGTLDPAFSGGSITHSFSSSATISSTP